MAQKAFLFGQTWHNLPSTAAPGRRRTWRVDVTVNPVTNQNLAQHVANIFHPWPGLRVCVTNIAPNFAAINAVANFVRFRPSRLTVPELCYLYEMLSGTAVAYLGRGMANQHQVGGFKLSVATHAEHARLLSAEWASWGHVCVCELDVADKPCYRIGQRVMGLPTDQLTLEEDYMKLMFGICPPYSVLNPDGTQPTRADAQFGIASFLTGLNQGLLGRNFHRIDGAGRNYFSWAAVIEAELQYCWWHREAHVSHAEIESGAIGVRVAPEANRAGSPVSQLQRNFGGLP